MSIKKTVTSQATPDTAVTLIDGRYLIHEKIGEGGIGNVYRVTDRLAQRTLALKQMVVPIWHYQVDQDTAEEIAEALRLALAREFKSLISLHHPNLIALLDYGFDEEKRPYFTMDYWQQAVTILAAGAQLDELGKVNLIQQLLQALAYLHRHGILHRDLKPSNVLVRHNIVRVLDFGFATTQESARQTAGSIPYVAPEVWEDQPYTKAADLYAVGVIAFELFASRHPFDINSHRFIEQVITELPNLSLLNASPAVTAVIATLLEKSKEARFPSAQACLAALSQAIGQPDPAESSVIRESYDLQPATFVGRTAEKAQLLNALEAAAQGRGSTWLICGESGVGKTRLLDEIDTQALVQGALVLRGQLLEDEVLEDKKGTPQQVWHNLLRRLVLTTWLDDSAVGMLQPLIPDIGRLLHRDVPSAPESAVSAHLLNAVAHLFRNQTRWILLIMEDLQWAKEELEILQRLSELAPQLPLLIIGSCRNDAQSSLGARLPLMQTLFLQRLSGAEIVELSVSVLGEVGGNPELISLLQRETKGNAFLLMQALARKVNHAEENPYNS